MYGATRRQKRRPVSLELESQVGELYKSLVLESELGFLKEHQSLLIAELSLQPRLIVILK